MHYFRFEETGLHFAGVHFLNVKIGIQNKNSLDIPIKVSIDDKLALV